MSRPKFRLARLATLVPTIWEVRHAIRSEIATWLRYHAESDGVVRDLNAIRTIRRLRRALYILPKK